MKRRRARRSAVEYYTRVGKPRLYVQDELAFTRKSLHRALFADEWDDAAVANLSAKVLALEKQIADLHVKHATAMADVLTAEQRWQRVISPP